MSYMTSAEIRSTFLKYFEGKGCKVMPSASLIPDDPSLLLTSAGMVQFKPYFLQQKKLPEKYSGTCTCQKCVRTNDIDIIGTTGRHLTFFEMLGNFSFGKYFKKEMCEWSIDFSVNVMGLDINRLYFTVYKDDDETYEIWKNLGIDPSHISRLGEEDNFWRAGPTGPCGPCSELYYDQGEDFGCGKPDCAPGCDCDRFLEYWNLVFTQYDAQEDGTMKPLPYKNIDTGLGLERMAAILQGVSSNYDTDIMKSLIVLGEDIFGKEYGSDKLIDLNLRIIADHSRAITFMIADGILPGNEGREYVLRRLLRRCVVKAYLMGYKGPFLGSYVNKVIDLMGQAYPEIVDNAKLIKRAVFVEEERFGQTLAQGAQKLEEVLEHDEDEDVSDIVIPGEVVFLLHDTYGFPMEVTKEIAEERGFTIDEEGFNACMKEQVERARAANADESEAAWAIESNVADKILTENGPTEFVGYDVLEYESEIIAIGKDGKLVEALHDGQQGSIAVKTTPFYAEMGGQVGDSGYISKGKNNEAQVVNTIYPAPGLVAHMVKVVGGNFKIGDKVCLEVDAIRRARISRNHTATHILHWALRDVLGEHVMQAGSYVAPDRLRFDFTHFEAVSPDQLRKIELLANEKIMSCSDVNTYQTTLKEARENGVTALFGEKYGEEVRVVEVGNFSAELCGGSHVNNTCEIGLVKITSESSVGSNSRRIEACTSFDAYNYCNNVIDQVDAASALLKAPKGQLVQSVEKNIKTIKDLKEELDFAHSSESTQLRKEAFKNIKKSSAGFDYLCSSLGDLRGNDMKEFWDAAADHFGDNCAVVFGGENNGKALLMAAGTSKAVEAGFDAVKIIKAIAPKISGGGGGQPRMAQAGGKNVDGIEEAINIAKEMLA